MQPEKPLHDLEPEAQAKIQQLMYNEQQKLMGKPTSEEQVNLIFNRNPKEKKTESMNIFDFLEIS